MNSKKYTLEINEKDLNFLQSKMTSGSRFEKILNKATLIDSHLCTECGKGRKLPFSDRCGSCCKKDYGYEPW